MSLSVGEWLQVAGVSSLDEESQAFRLSAFEGVGTLSHRSTGILLDVNLHYRAGDYDEPELCVSLPLSLIHLYIHLFIHISVYCSFLHSLDLFP